MLKTPKIIVMTGGVYSSIGKGILLSSIGKILVSLNYKVSILKLDPYLNINSGLLSPNQHGEVFVTEDGEETDLDLGHYERFLDINISKKSCYTCGKIYKRILEKESNGEITGRTIQVIPDVINEIHHIIKELYVYEGNSDFLLIEIGGTVGDIESIPFIAASKYLVGEYGKENILFIHVVPNIYLNNTKEFKSKPAQHSINHLLSYGITPDLLIIKSVDKNTENIKNKIAENSLISHENIIISTMQSSIYTVPNELFENNIHKKILNHFGMKLEILGNPLEKWKNFTNKIDLIKKHKLRLAIIAKYVDVADAYLSIIESFKFAAIHDSVDLQIDIIDAEKVIDFSLLKNIDMFCIPHGFGSRGQEGKIIAIQFARENNVPCLGICFGFQLMCIEYAKNVLKINDATSEEFNIQSNNLIIIKNLQGISLGNKTIQITENSISKKIFNNNSSINFRHRHKFIFNNEYKEKFNNSDLMFSGWSGDILEIIELPTHSFFLGVQFHPEFNSRPEKHFCLFKYMMNIAINICEKTKGN